MSSREGVDSCVRACSLPALEGLAGSRGLGGGEGGAGLSGEQVGVLRLRLRGGGGLSPRVVATGVPLGAPGARGLGPASAYLLSDELLELLELLRESALLVQGTGRAVQLLRVAVELRGGHALVTGLQVAVGDRGVLDEHGGRGEVQVVRGEVGLSEEGGRVLEVAGGGLGVEGGLGLLGGGRNSAGRGMCPPGLLGPAARAIGLDRECGLLLGHAELDGGVWLDSCVGSGYERGICDFRKLYRVLRLSERGGRFANRTGLAKVAGHLYGGGVIRDTGTGTGTTPPRAPRLCLRFLRAPAGWPVCGGGGRGRGSAYLVRLYAADSRHS